MNIRKCIAAARISGPSLGADGTTVFEFGFKADHPAFAGHFPTHPLLPGVFQLEMSRAAAEWAMGCGMAIGEVSKAKFQRPILPGEVIHLELKWTETEDSILARADFSVGGQRAGQSILKLWRRK